MLAPVEPEPADRVGDRVLELDILLDRIGIVETQMALAAVLGGEAEVQDDRLRMSVMQIAIRLRWETRDDLAAMLAGSVILGNQRAQEIDAGTADSMLRFEPARRHSMRERIFLAAVQHSFRFVHEQSHCIWHSNRQGRTRQRPFPSAGVAMPGNPRQTRLPAGSGYPLHACCPQILWIKVCVSCKFCR
jgi:hypothetical protein